MTAWDNKAFDAQSAGIVQAWIAAKDQGGASLNTLVEKVARDHSLNPEQIRRLCRSSTSKAFNAVFEKKAREGAPDRMVDFDIANEDTVISALHAAASGSSEKQAEYPSLADETIVLRPSAPPLFPKEAQVFRDVDKELDQLLGRDIHPTEVLLHMQKVAEEARGRAAHASYKWRDALDKLASEQSRIGFDRDSFECDVIAAAGADGVWVINELRSRAKLASLDVPTEKVPELLNHIVGADTHLARLAKTAAEKRSEEAYLREVVVNTQTEIESLRENLGVR